VAKKVILDVDTGVDDAVAVILALRSPELEVLGITTVTGNVDVGTATRNTLHVLELLDRADVPVCPGARGPVTPGTWSVGERFHGAGGLGGVQVPEPSIRPREEHAVDFIRRTVREEGPGEVTLITTAPMTNVALSLLIEPDLAERLAAIVSMGGAFCTGRQGTGNSSPRGEFNVWFDPVAAKVVYNSGARVYAVGLDVTTRRDAAISRELYERIAESPDEVARFVHAILGAYVEAVGYAPMHDPMAVASVIRPDLLTFELLPVDVEICGELTRGETVADFRDFDAEVPRRRPNVHVAVDVDGPEFLRLLLDRVAGLELG